MLFVILNWIIYNLVSSEKLKGSSPYEKALVQQFTSFADNEILPASYAWVYPSLSIAQFNKSVMLNYLISCLILLFKILIIIYV